MINIVQNDWIRWADLVLASTIVARSWGGCCNRSRPKRGGSPNGGGSPNKGGSGLATSLHGKCRAPTDHFLDRCTYLSLAVLRMELVLAVKRAIPIVHNASCFPRSLFKAVVAPEVVPDLMCKGPPSTTSAVPCESSVPILVVSTHAAHHANCAWNL
jgi:hypothetical protein